MLQPKKTKYRKSHKGKSRGVAKRGTSLEFGQFGLKSMGTKWITSRQIEAARTAIIRTLKRKGQLWIRIFPDKPVTFKGHEVPMGGGKGAVDHYVYPIEPGRIIFEVAGVEKDLAKQAFKKASHKLPIKTKFMSRE